MGEELKNFVNLEWFNYAGKCSSCTAVPATMVQELSWFKEIHGTCGGKFSIYGSCLEALLFSSKKEKKNPLLLIVFRKLSLRSTLQSFEMFLIVDLHRKRESNVMRIWSIINTKWHEEVEVKNWYCMVWYGCFFFPETWKSGLNGSCVLFLELES